MAEKRQIQFEDYQKKNLAKYLNGISAEGLEAIKIMVKIS